MTTTLARNEKADDAEPARIGDLLAQLRDTRQAVDGRSWLSPELAGLPAAPLGTLGSTGSPLSALDGAGVGFLTPMVSFLEEPLHQLRGDPGPVSSGAGELDGAARDGTSVAQEYRSATKADTGQWSGKAASDYLKTGTDLADGILSIAETSLTSAKSIIGAGEVVAQVVAAVTEHVNTAVDQIVPIMTTALAQAPATFGASVAEAIPHCVGIATEQAAQIATKLGALLASGDNLIKLIDAAVGIVKIVKEVMSFIGKQSQGGGSTAKPGDNSG